MRGTYVLVIRLARRATIRVGALGEIAFPAASYAYVGSAMGGLEQRITRHLRLRKRCHWHIDHLLAHARVMHVLRLPGDERLECTIARALAERLDAIPRFGCSDCRCQSHLFVHPDAEYLRAAVATVLSALA
ncbi:MAG: DUF123 domain-containing protein [Armatimonadota bacterium]